MRRTSSNAPRRRSWCQSRSFSSGNLPPGALSPWSHAEVFKSRPNLAANSRASFLALRSLKTCRGSLMSAPNNARWTSSGILKNRSRCGCCHFSHKNTFSVRRVEQKVDLLVPQSVEEIVEVMQIILLERAVAVPWKCFFDRGAGSCLFLEVHFPPVAQLSSTVVRASYEGNPCFSAHPLGRTRSKLKCLPNTHDEQPGMSKNMDESSEGA